MQRTQDPRTNHPGSVALALPATRLGWVAVGLDELFVVSVMLFAALVASGQEAGQALTDNFLLTATVLSALVCSVAAGLSALIAIMRRGERSILDVVALAVGAFVLLFVLAEYVATL